MTADTDSLDLELNRWLTGFWTSQAIYAAAKLQLADHLAAGPKSAEELAALTGCRADGIARLLRALAGLGFFRRASEGYALGPAGERLRRDVPGSKWAFAVMLGEEHFFAWGDILHSLRTGESAFAARYGKPVFDYLADHPQQAAVFDAAMTGVHGREVGPMVDAYDFTTFGKLIDVGGGNGSMLCEILRRVPRMQGVVYDLPHVAERTQQRLAGTEFSSRCQAQGGDFFRSVPAEGDAYLLRHIIHDWEDAESRLILQNIAAAMPAHAKVLIIECVIEENDAPSFGKWLDLNMLVIPGGRERTAAEYRALLASSGLTLTRVVPTAAEVSVIEATKA